MAGPRYAQFCPLARSAEILGERWTLLLIRELMCGPQRFSDLLRRLPGLSSSVLATRLEGLERRGIVRRAALPPPAASNVYELDEAGHALAEPLFGLMRWGLRFLHPEPGDHIEPEWVGLGLRAFARRDASPSRRIELGIARDDPSGPAEHRVLLVGGPHGTRIEPPGSGEADLRVVGTPFAVLGLASGGADPGDLLRAGGIRAEGDVDALADFAALFDFSPGPSSSDGAGAAGGSEPSEPTDVRSPSPRTP